MHTLLHHLYATYWSLIFAYKFAGIYQGTGCDGDNREKKVKSVDTPGQGYFLENRAKHLGSKQLSLH